MAAWGCAAWLPNVQGVLAGAAAAQDTPMGKLRALKRVASWLDFSSLRHDVSFAHTEAKLEQYVPRH